MSDVDIQLISKIKEDMLCGYAAFKKQAVFSKSAFTPAAPPAGPQMAPQDPNAMPPGGAPPMDPNAMPPQDPNAMPPQDPNAAPPAPDAGAQGVPPELQQVLSDLAGGVQGMSDTMKEQQSAIDQLAQRQLELEKTNQELRQLLKGPQPFDQAPQEAPAPAQA